MLDKIYRDIEAVKEAQVKAELEIMAQANARLEAARAENDRRRIAAEEAQEKATQAHLEKRKHAEATAKELERAEQARTRAEEHKINLAMEAKAQEEKEAAELKKRLLDLQFQHEQALKALKDSYDLAANSLLAGTEEKSVVNPDGSERKPLVDNVDGTVNPLSRFRQNVNA